MWNNSVVPFILYLCPLYISYRIEPIDNNVITVAGFRGTGIGAVPVDGAQAPKYVGVMHQIHVFNRYYAFIWY